MLTLGSYSNALKFDNTIEQAERDRRWAERQTWEALGEAERAQRFRAMQEEERMRLGLGASGLYVRFPR